MNDIIPVVVGREFYFGAFCELEQVWVRIDVLDWLDDPNIRLAILLVVDPLLRTDALLAASNSRVPGKLRPTLHGRKQGLGCLPGVETHPDLTFEQQTVQTGLIRVALPLVAIQVVPARERVVAEAAGEPGARLPPREPLLVAGLPVPAEVHGGLPERFRDHVARQAGYWLSISDYYYYYYYKDI